MVATFMSRYASDLCTLLVDETYGQLTSRVFQALLFHGRCSLPALHHRTRLSHQQIRHALSVLIQHDLIFWSTSFADNSTAYEANAAAAYNLIRNGKYVQLTERRLDLTAIKVINHLLLVGHARVSDLVKAFDLSHVEDAKTQSITLHKLPNGINSKANENGRVNYEDPNPLKLLHHALCDLLQADLICKVHESHFRSDVDNRTEAERNTRPIEEYKASKKGEREAMWNANIQRTLSDWKYGTAAETADIAKLKKGIKRPLEHAEAGECNKRSRLDLSFKYLTGAEGGPQGNISQAGYFSDEIVFRVDRDKFSVLLRTHHLVELAEQSTCTGTSRVYEKVLHMIESQVRECKNTKQLVGFGEYNDFGPTHITTEAIVTALPESLNLMNVLGMVADDEVEDDMLDHPRRRRRKGGQEEFGPIVVDDDEEEGDDDDEEDEEDVSSDGNISAISDDENEDIGNAEYDPLNKGLLRSPHYNAVRSHLLLLAQHPIGFLTHVARSSNTLESWTVNFPELIMSCQSRTITQTVTARYGTPSARLMNILAEQGKLDEKTLSSLSLIREKEMRNRLTTMQKAGLLELQEVPRDNARVASRTNFLFFYDHDRCKRNLSEECYKTLTRLLERARVEKEKVKGTMEKASRSDVIGREEQLLSLAEREALQQWQDNEAKIWGQIGRVDDMVALLRDF